jgi:hypothetical protein
MEELSRYLDALLVALLVALPVWHGTQGLFKERWLLWYRTSYNMPGKRMMYSPDA